MDSTEFVMKLALVALTFSDYPSNSDWLDPNAYVAACHALDDLFSVTYADAPAAHIVELMKYLTAAVRGLSAHRALSQQTHLTGLPNSYDAGMMQCSWALWPLLDRAGACPALATPELQCAIANLHRETYGDVYAAFGWGADPTGLTGEQMREAAEGACASNGVSVGNMDYLMGKGEVRAKVEDGSPGDLLLEALSPLDVNFQTPESEYALSPTVPAQTLPNPFSLPDGSPPLDTSNLLDWKRSTTPSTRPRAQSLRRAPSDTSGLLRTALAGSMAAPRAPHNQLRRAASTESFAPRESFVPTQSFPPTWSFASRAPTQSFAPRAPESLTTQSLRPLQRTDSMQSTDTEVASPVLRAKVASPVMRAKVASPVMRAKPLGPSGSTLGMSALTLRRADSMHMDGMQRADSMQATPTNGMQAPRMDGMQATPTASMQDTPTTSMQSVYPQAPARRAKPLGPSGTTFGMTAPFSTLSLGRSDSEMSIGSPGFTFRVPQADNGRAYPVVGQNLQGTQATPGGQQQQQDPPQARRTGKPLTRVTYPPPPLEYVSAPRDRATRRLARKPKAARCDPLQEDATLTMDVGFTRKRKRMAEEEGRTKRTRGLGKENSLESLDDDVDMSD